MLPLAFINTFTDLPFRGNPAAVCLLNEQRDASWLQAVAEELNMPTTAFIIKVNGDYHLRWFTPSTEIPICGHGTLASSYFLWENGLIHKEEPIEFGTKSGILKAVYRDGGWIELEFPAMPHEETSPPELLVQALKTQYKYVGKSELDYLVEVESENVVKNLEPDFSLIAQLPVRGVIVTSKSSSAQYDFVSRFFSPAQGLNEDYVNGSSHCCLGPYWQKKLHKAQLTAYQASKRGGVLKVEVLPNKVLLAGKAITVFEGNLRTG